MRRDREDTTAQREREATARKKLHDALSTLAREAALAAKAAGSGAKRAPDPDLPAVYAATSAVRRAEEELDLAKADLDTASGGDL
jgi:hypothetical protein